MVLHLDFVLCGRCSIPSVTMIATERFSSRDISLDLSKEVTKKAVVRLDVQQHTVSFFTFFMAQNSNAPFAIGLRATGRSSVETHAFLTIRLRDTLHP